MKTINLAALVVLAGCLAGCVSDKDEIVFTAVPPPYNSEGSQQLVPAVPKLTQEAEGQIEMRVFSYLVEHHFWDDKVYSAIFVQADDKIETALVKKYANHSPPVKESYRAHLPKNQTPIDADTNKAAAILSLEIDDPDTDGVVVVLGRWYAGGAITGFYTFKLQKQKNDWKIQEVK